MPVVIIFFPQISEQIVDRSGLNEEGGRIARGQVAEHPGVQCYSLFSSSLTMGQTKFEYLSLACIYG